MCLQGDAEAGGGVEGQLGVEVLEVARRVRDLLAGILKLRRAADERRRQRRGIGPGARAEPACVDAGWGRFEITLVKFWIHHRLCLNEMQVKTSVHSTEESVDCFAFRVWTNNGCFSMSSKSRLGKIFIT